MPGGHGPKLAQSSHIPGYETSGKPDADGNYSQTSYPVLPEHNASLNRPSSNTYMETKPEYSPEVDPYPDNWNGPYDTVPRSSSPSTSYNRPSTIPYPGTNSYASDKPYHNTYNVQHWPQSAKTHGPDLFELDPQMYFSDVSALSQKVYHIDETTFRSIQSKENRYVLPLANQSFPETIPPSELQRRVGIHMKDRLQTLYAIQKGVQVLQDEKFCASGYNMIVVDATRANVLTVISISMPVLSMLSDLLHQGVLSLAVSSLKFESILEDVQEILLYIVSSLSLNIPFDSNHFGTRNQKWQAICHLLSSVLSVLHLALMSFIRSHIDIIGDTPTGVISSALQIETLGGSIVMAPRCLECLDGFLKQPVWAFSYAAESSNSDLGSDRYYLSTSIQDFAELWGPLKAEYSGKSFGFIRFIEVRGGSIFRLSESDSPVSLRQDETLCHWISWLQVENPVTASEPMLIDTTKHLLIGTLRTKVYENPTPDKEPGPKLLFSLYSCKCGGGPGGYSSNYGAFELKTRPSSYKLDAKSVQLSGGKYLTANIGYTYKLDVGKTLKDVLLENWIGSPTTLSSHISNPNYLDYLVILEISSCSGNARRISLWTLLKQPPLHLYLRHNMSFESWEKLEGLVLYHSSTEHIATEWWNLSSTEVDTLTTVFRYLLEILRSIGVSENRLLQAWDITSVNRIDGRKIHPSWASMVADDMACATFAIITPTCMRYVSPRRDIQRTDTVLHTKVCIPRTDKHPRKRYIPTMTQQPQRTPRYGSKSEEGSAMFSKWQIPVPDTSRPNNDNNPSSSNRPQSDKERELLGRLRHNLDQRYKEVRGYDQNFLEEPRPTTSAEQGRPSFSAEYNTVLYGNTMNLESMARPPSRIQAPLRVKDHNRLRFVNDRGREIGKLILEHESQFSFDFHRSEMVKLQARWKECRYRSMGAILQWIERFDQWVVSDKIENWLERSQGIIPWVTGQVLPRNHHPPSVGEYIRLERLPEQNVVEVYIR
jgi:hypothetical protein